MVTNLIYTALPSNSTRSSCSKLFVNFNKSTEKTQTLKRCNKSTQAKKIRSAKINPKVIDL